MCSRDLSTATCWKWLIFTGSVRLKTPPTPFCAPASVICPSDSNCICSSFSSSVILARRAFTRASTGGPPGALPALLAARPPTSRLAVSASTATTACRLLTIRCLRKRTRVIENLRLGDETYRLRKGWVGARAGRSRASALAADLDTDPANHPREAPQIAKQPRRATCHQRP